ncbi:MAG: DUF1294 domain-containing protein [Lentisphaerae bacterium]|nr:DUF1294 domain-containing protein [Lentisphaerota bacterium]
MYFIITILMIWSLALVNKWLFLLAMGLFSAGLFAYDKFAAVHRRWRIPEKVLLTAALLGGAVFALFTMSIIRHKTRKMWFYNSVVVMALMQMALVLWWC